MKFTEWLSYNETFEQFQALAQQFAQQFGLKLTHTYPIMHGIEVGVQGNLPPIGILRDWWKDQGAHGVGASTSEDQAKLSVHMWDRPWNRA